MSDPFLGEIKMWAFPWAPRNWALCNGAILQVQQNQALAALLGSTFGGQWPTTFALPDLRGRTPIGIGNYQNGSPAYAMGNAGGAEAVALNITTVPPHMHTVNAYNTDAPTISPSGADFGKVTKPTTVTANIFIYTPTNGEAIAQPVGLAADTINTVGSGAPHNNMQPFTVVNFCICTAGIWPPRP